MFYDPYDEETQVKFHRTDPTGRIVALEDDDYEEFTGEAMRVAAIVAMVMLALIAWWLW